MPTSEDIDKTESKSGTLVSLRFYVCFVLQGNTTEMNLPNQLQNLELVAGDRGLTFILTFGRRPDFAADNIDLQLLEQLTLREAPSSSFDF